MINFLFKKDLWILDLITSLSFSVFFGYLILVDSVTKARNWKDILIGTAAYGVTFVLALFLQKKLPSVRSWMWMGIVGALVRIIFLNVIYFSKIWDYNLRFSPSLFEAVTKTLLDFLQITLFNWIFWAIGGLAVIFAARFLFFVFFKLFNILHLQTNELQGSSK